jgi:hypothetical protein
MNNLFQKSILFAIFAFGTYCNALAQSISDNKTRYVISNGLNVRAAESTDAKVIITLSKCDELTLLGYESSYTTVNGKSGHWVQIRAKGKMGYVFDANISMLMGIDCLEKRNNANKKESTDNIVLEPLTDLYKGKYMTVEKNMTVLYTAAALNSKGLYFISKGEKVLYLDYTEVAADDDSSTNAQFIKVKYKGKIGYINSDFVVEKNIFD